MESASTSTSAFLVACSVALAAVVVVCLTVVVAAVASYPTSTMVAADVVQLPIWVAVQTPVAVAVVEKFATYSVEYEVA